MFYYLLFAALSGSMAFIIERKETADVCDGRLCPESKSMCSTSLKGKDIACYSCKDIIGTQFSTRCIPHIIGHNIELFALPPLLILEFNLGKRQWLNYTSFQRDSKNRIILDWHGRSGKAYLLITSRVIVALKFLGFETFFVTSTTSRPSSTIKLTTHFPTTTQSKTRIMTSTNHPSTARSSTHFPATTVISTAPPTSTSSSTRLPTTTTVLVPTAPPTTQSETTITSTTSYPTTTSITTMLPSSTSTSATPPTHHPFPTIITSATISSSSTTTSPITETRQSSSRTSTASPSPSSSSLSLQTTSSTHTITKIVPPPTDGKSIGLIVGLVLTAFVISGFLGILCYKLRSNITRYILPQPVPDDTISMSTINTLPDADETIV